MLKFNCALESEDTITFEHVDSHKVKITIENDGYPATCAEISRSTVLAAITGSQEDTITSQTGVDTTVEFSWCIFYDRQETLIVSVITGCDQEALSFLNSSDVELLWDMLLGG